MDNSWVIYGNLCFPGGINVYIIVFFFFVFYCFLFLFLRQITERLLTR